VIAGPGCIVHPGVQEIAGGAKFGHRRFRFSSRFLADFSVASAKIVRIAKSAPGRFRRILPIFSDIAEFVNHGSSPVQFIVAFCSRLSSFLPVFFSEN
jgi:hypothetical protein